MKSSRLRNKNKWLFIFLSLIVKIKPTFADDTNSIYRCGAVWTNKVCEQGKTLNDKMNKPRAEIKQPYINTDGLKNTVLSISLDPIFDDSVRTIARHDLEISCKDGEPPQKCEKKAIELLKWLSKERSISMRTKREVDRLLLERRKIDLREKGLRSSIHLRAKRN